MSILNMPSKQLNDGWMVSWENLFLMKTPRKHHRPRSASLVWREVHFSRIHFSKDMRQRARESGCRRCPRQLVPLSIFFSPPRLPRLTTLNRFNHLRLQSHLHTLALCTCGLAITHQVQGWVMYHNHRHHRTPWHFHLNHRQSKLHRKGRCPAFFCAGRTLTPQQRPYQNLHTKIQRSGVKEESSCGMEVCSVWTIS